MMGESFPFFFFGFLLLIYCSNQFFDQNAHEGMEMMGRMRRMPTAKGQLPGRKQKREAARTGRTRRRRMVWGGD